MDKIDSWWKTEFQYLLDRKILSRDELSYLFSQIKSIIEQEKMILLSHIFAEQPQPIEKKEAISLSQEGG